MRYWQSMSFFPTRQIAVQVGPVAIHWYGLMYLAAFLLAWWLIPKLTKHRGFLLSRDQLGNLLTYSILGTLFGGRLGYVLFYGAEYFSTYPWDIFAIWKGGMSSHGGFIGVAFALFLFAKREKIDFFRLVDVLVVPAALGLALGRFGNFINQELYGPVTDLPWGISIPGVEGLRHPTPLYAMGKDLLIAALCFLHLAFSSSSSRSRLGAPGTTTALFLILYGILRFAIEYLRVETATGLDLGLLYLTRGQLLTIPLIVLGAAILLRLFWGHSDSYTPVLGSQ